VSCARSRLREPSDEECASLCKPPRGQVEAVFPRIHHARFPTALHGRAEGVQSNPAPRTGRRLAGHSSRRRGATGFVAHCNAAVAPHARPRDARAAPRPRIRPSRASLSPVGSGMCDLAA
jgi:hypothetical protein